MIDESIMEKIIPLPDEDEEMELSLIHISEPTRRS